MRKRVLTLALLPLLLIGCNKASDSEIADGSASNKTDETTSKKTDGDTSGKETDPTVDKESLYKQFKSGFDSFFANDQDVTYECQATMNTSDEDGAFKSIIRGKGTLGRENGLFYNEMNSYMVDSATGTETLFENKINYTGVADGKNMYYEKEDEDRTSYIVDQYYYSTAYENALSQWGLDEIDSVFGGATSFKAATASIKYSLARGGATIGCDVVNSEQGIAFTIEMDQEEIDVYFGKSVSSYSFVVKDGFLSKMIMSYDESTYYPNDTSASYSGMLEFNFEKRFDESFYKTFQDFSSYVASTKGVKTSVEVYYEDYYYDSLSYYLGSDIELDSTMLACFDGLYYDKDFKMPYTSKKCTSDVKEMYVKLKSTPDASMSIVYELTEATTIFYNNVLPATVWKEINIAYSTSSTYWSYSWKKTGESDRARLNEKMTVNGIETTDNGIVLQNGVIYTIKHTYTSY